jgi:long-chain fatty acid transport protein
VNLSLSENFNIGIKYEFLTKLELENDTEIDETGMFPDGATTRSDMPAMLSVGAAYRATPQLNIAGGIHYYFDRSADYGKSLPNEDIIDNNFIELALGLEYNLTDDLLLSTGYLRTQTGVNDLYHSDLSHSLNTNSIGLGGRYSINEMMAVNLGFLMTFYDEDQVTRNYGILGSAVETYNREVMVFSLGLDFKF